MSRIRHISLVFVSDRSGQSRELRMPRFLFIMFASTVVTGLLIPVVLLVLSPQFAGVVEISFARPLKNQIESIQERSMELTRRLEELKETARSIRKLAGVEGIETDSSLQVQVNNPQLVANRNGLPFLMDDSRLPVIVEPNSVKGRAALFRYVPSIWPTGGWVTREFKHGDVPILSTHFGMDVAAREGAPVLSTADGVVTFADWDQDLGWLVEIDHGYDVVTRYGHNSRLRVDSGQLVHRGQIIALVGNTGRSSGPHLHYEVLKNNVPVNPRGYLPEAIVWDELLVSVRTHFDF